MKSESISALTATDINGKCFRLREGAGIRRVVGVRGGTVTFVTYQETERAGMSAFLSDPDFPLPATSFKTQRT